MTNARTSVRRFAALATAALLGVVAAPMGNAEATTPAPSAWLTAGADGGYSYWNAQETTVTPARAKLMKLNYTVSNAVSSNEYACMLPVPPVTSAGRLFESGPTGISAYNQWSGQRLWTYAGVYDTSVDYVQSLHVLGSTLVVVLVGEGCVSNTGTNTIVLQLDVTTGADVHAVFNSDWGTAESAAVTNGIAVLTSRDGGTGESAVTAIVLSTGVTLWSTALGYVAEVAGPSGLVYGTLPGYTGAVVIRALDGTVAGRLPAGVQPDRLTLSQGGADLYGTDANNSLYDMNPSTGAIKWVKAGRGGDLAVTNTTIYSSCGLTVLCATRRSTGAAMWKISVPATPIAHPLTAAGVVYVNGRSFLATTGQRITSAADGTTITAVAGGRTYGLLYDSSGYNARAFVSYK